MRTLRLVLLILLFPIWLPIYVMIMAVGIMLSSQNQTRVAACM